MKTTNHDKESFLSLFFKQLILNLLEEISALIYFFTSVCQESDVILRSIRRAGKGQALPGEHDFSVHPSPRQIRNAPTNAPK